MALKGWKSMKCAVITAMFAFLLISLRPGICFADGGVASVEQYGLFEVSFTCPDMKGNPFDPVDNDVWATMTGPKGRVRIPAFWDGNVVWKARFAPETVGEYKVTLERNGVDETTNATSPTVCDCTPSTAHGFVRVSNGSAGWPHFVYDDGTTYFPMGLDAGWTTPEQLDYSDLFTKMNQCGLNYARVWMTNWDGKALDWGESQAQSPAPGILLISSAQSDDALLLAATNSSVYVQLSLQYHGSYSRSPNSGWFLSPYNSQNSGGFLADPDDFFTDTRSIDLTKDKFRYIIARYAWCSHLLGWELYNEIESDVGIKEDDYTAWHRIMEDFIRSIDPYHHLITSSDTDPTIPLAQNTNLDYFTQRAFPKSLEDFFRTLPSTPSTKPLIFGAVGASGRQTRDILHGGLWSGLMDPLAGAPQYWFWSKVEVNNWWPEFTSISNFAAASGLLTAKDSAVAPAAVQTDTTAALRLYPALDWAKETGDGVVTVTPTGQVSGMDGISRYIQGQDHRDMMPDPLTLQTDFPMPVTVHVRISSISPSGSHLVIAVDGQTADDVNYPGTGFDSNVNVDQPFVVGAGKHSIAITNIGPDHFTLEDIVIDDVIPAAAVMVRRIDQKYVFWISRTSQGTEDPIKLTMSIGGVASRNYNVTFFDTLAGQVAGSPTMLSAASGALVIPVTLTGNDVAGWITPIP
jgi:hypothetical protein